jgi:hypothetical protein
MLLLIRFVAAVVISIWISTSALLAGTIHPDVPDEKYIEFGAKFDFVTRIRGDLLKPMKEEKHVGASAVLIAPRWAITAAHVTDGATNFVIIMEKREKPIKVMKVITHEGYGDETASGIDDISLCYVESDFGLDFYPGLYEDADEVGKDCTISGYGCTGTFARGIDPKKEMTKWVKRAGSNRVEVVCPSILIVTPSNHNRTPLEFIICPGDSGGGLFIGSKLAGINSFIVTESEKAPIGTYMSFTGHTRVSAYADWIKRQMEQYELELQARGTTGADLKLKARH